MQETKDDGETRSRQVAKDTTGHEWDGIAGVRRAAAEMVAVDILRHHSMAIGYS